MSMVSVGIDIGTTSICVILYDGQTDKIMKEFHGENHFLVNGSFLQDPQQILKTVKELLLQLFSWYRQCEKEKTKTEKEIVGIGISSQMHGILYVNKEGKAVSPFYTWKNEYGNEIYRDGVTYAEYLSEKAGCRMYSGYGSVTHFYLQQKGLLPGEGISFVNIGDYLAMELTGEKTSLADVTMAASFGGFLTEKGCFDFEKLKAAGVNTSYYPEVVKGKATGIFQAEAEVTPVPVYPAIGDNQASFLGAVRNKEDSISINVGTGSQVSIFSTEFCETKELEIRPFLEAGYLYVGASLNGGKVYERLAVFFREICSFFTGKEVDVYEKMEELGGKKKETDLRAVPCFYGERGKRKRDSGFLYLTEENFHGADIIRSFITGMAEELHDLYMRFPKEITQEKKRIVASGNGIRKNRLLQEEIEKAFHMPIIFTDREEEAAAGAALRALLQPGKEVHYADSSRD